MDHSHPSHQQQSKLWLIPYSRDALNELSTQQQRPQVRIATIRIPVVFTVVARCMVRVEHRFTMVDNSSCSREVRSTIPTYGEHTAAREDRPPSQLSRSKTCSSQRWKNNGYPAGFLNTTYSIVYCTVSREFSDNYSTHVVPCVVDGLP